MQLKKGEVKPLVMVLEEQFPVRNLKPAVVKVYDYYQPGERRLPRRVTVGVRRHGD